jgi:hypothetical protein
MTHVLTPPVGVSPDCASDQLLPDLATGSRFRVKSRGRYSRGLEGRTGTVLGFAHTTNMIRVLLDGQKCPQTLHRGYLQLLADAAS